MVIQNCLKKLHLLENFCFISADLRNLSLVNSPLQVESRTGTSGGLNLRWCQVRELLFKSGDL